MAPVARFLAHTLPAVILVLMAYWMGEGLRAYAKSGDSVVAKDTSGFAWGHGDARVFNWHPLLMTLGLVFCSTQAALAYISLPFTHAMNKRIHLSLHALGLLSALVGVVAVFRFHNEHGITNLYSLHSWLGLIVVIAFALHYLGSFVTFFYPGATPAVRASAIPYHIGFGLALLGLVYVTAATGILEKLSFNGSCNVNGVLNGHLVSGYMAADCVLGNTLGLLLAAAFAALVVTIWHNKHSAQEKPLGDERTPLLSSESGDDKTEVLV